MAKAAKGAKKAAVKRAPAKPRLLSGGNPQIAKGYGDAPVQAFIAATPDWRRDVCRRLDALIVSAVPRVAKAVKWNSPFYGVSEGRWFLSFHVFTNYVKVAFFHGAHLKPVPPGTSKQKNVRYYDVYEGALDEAQFTKWVKQQVALGADVMVAKKKTVAKKTKAAPKAGDWRKEKLAQVRAIIEAADPEASEEAKWKKATNPAGVPTWSHDGIICTGETYKDKVKLTFAQGAALKDPAKLFNAGLDGGTRRAIDIFEGGTINEKALKALVRDAVALNTAKPAKKKRG